MNDYVVCPQEAAVVSGSGRGDARRAHAHDPCMPPAHTVRTCNICISQPQNSYFERTAQPRKGHELARHKCRLFYILVVAAVTNLP